jgi:hypothetical protein
LIACVLLNTKLARGPTEKAADRVALTLGRLSTNP